MSNWKELTLIELKALGVRELQAACKEAGIKSGVKIDDMAQRLFESIGHEMENIPDDPVDVTDDKPKVKVTPKTEKPDGGRRIGKRCTFPGCKDSFGHPGIIKGDAHGASTECSGRRKHKLFYDE